MSRGRAYIGEYDDFNAAEDDDEPGRIARSLIWAARKACEGTFEGLKFRVNGWRSKQVKS